MLQRYEIFTIYASIRPSFSSMKLSNYIKSF